MVSAILRKISFMFSRVISVHPNCFAYACTVSFLKNLKLLSDSGKQIVLRCPLIPGINDRREHAENIAALSRAHRGVISIEIEPYHPLGVTKGQRFGMRPKYDRDTFMDKGEAEAFADIVRGNTAVPVTVK